MLRLASRTARAAAAGAARPAHALADAAAGLQSLRLLVVGAQPRSWLRCASDATCKDGYDQKGRDDLAAGGASVASELYRSMLTRHSPVPVTVDVLFPSDPGYQQPSQEARGVVLWRRRAVLGAGGGDVLSAVPELTPARRSSSRTMASAGRVRAAAALQRRARRRR